ncbi:MAG: quinone-dependent dihydroorotate dehydrogenase [Gammaproteobacteria bacterium]|nr:MAG: quinone-dependent dihydroorotate dehydrogenase [Gammaproteobacteria bacterium]
MLYSLIKPLLFAVDAELAHEVCMELLNDLQALVPQTRVEKPVQVMGIEFPNPVGLAAGLDKNGDYLPGLSKLGFGFIEVGTVTPKPQAGNPRPRLFRLVRHQAIINRMGFNNKGVDYLLSQIPERPRPYVLGINIGKNLSTPLESALDDYNLALKKVYADADYITLNISSPNTPGLRQLQSEKALDSLLHGINESRKALQDHHQYNRPIALKVAPDLDDRAIPVIADLLVKHRIDGLIATNSTLDRSQVNKHALASEAGGLSGGPLCQKSRNVLSSFSQALQGEIPIISVGGIMSAEEAQIRLKLGASLVQLYSGLIYRGPGLASKIAQSIKI